MLADELEIEVAFVGALRFDPQIFAFSRWCADDLIVHAGRFEDQPRIRLPRSMAEGALPLKDRYNLPVEAYAWFRLGRDHAGEGYRAQAEKR